ncbi:helix-turn-helix transcriptional regulator [Mucilaginibacter sp.]|uniref:helix-turn-helix transcriptional regulator n=1 Tax=Mucilaginibacter sp. TaxID=1882438 RepID=UPI002D7EAEC4|nr:helix-turn-helix domain-containing protein [Mucilaginibacter sp.]
MATTASSNKLIHATHIYKNRNSNHEIKSIMTPQTATKAKSPCQTQLTHQFKRQLEKKLKRIYINKEFIEFIEETIKKFPVRDKLAALYFFKKLAVQLLRAPDPDHYKAFKDDYDNELSEIVDEQKHYNPVRWLNAEIEFITNTAERLTAEDVNERLNVMQHAKQRLSKPWLTKEDVMDLFNISKSTLNRRVADGMPAHKNGKFVYFYLEEVNEWMKQEAA